MPLRAILTAAALLTPATALADQHVSPHATPYDMTPLQVFYMSAMGHNVTGARRYLKARAHLLDGAGVSIGNYESGYNPFHPELSDANGNPRVIEVGEDSSQTTAKSDFSTDLITCTRLPTNATSDTFNLARCEDGYSAHGTATLSILGAKDDGIGVTGIVPKAKLYVSARLPDTTADQTPDFYAAETNMFDRLIAALPNYSVLLIEAQTDTGPPNHRFIPKSYDKHLDSAFRRAIQKGITVVYGAGNGGVLLDDPTKNDRFDDNQYGLIDLYGTVIPVAAASTGFRSLWIDQQPTFTLASSQSKFIPLYSLGENVATAGYASKNRDTPPDPNCVGQAQISHFVGAYIWPQDACQPWVKRLENEEENNAYARFSSNKKRHDVRQYFEAAKTNKDVQKAIAAAPHYYTDSFGGTSSASAIVAGLAASVQGYFQQTQATAKKPGLTGLEIHAVLLASARKSGRDIRFCAPDMLEAVKIIDEGVEPSGVLRSWAAQDIMRDFFDKKPITC